MKMLDSIKNISKDTVYDLYFRCVFDAKPYKKVTNEDMVKEVYKRYEDTEYLSYLLTEREVNYLKRLVNGEKDVDNIKYVWEQEQLVYKFLLIDPLTIPEEATNIVQNLLKEYDPQKYKSDEYMASFLIGFCKAHGIVLEEVLIGLGTHAFKLKEDIVRSFIYGSPLFNFYVGRYKEKNKNSELKSLIYLDYEDYMDELEKAREKYAIGGVMKFDIRDYQSMFYNYFNMEKPAIKKFYNELIKLPFYRMVARDINICVLLNEDREDIKKSIREAKPSEIKDLNKFFKLMDEAMNEMISGALGGYTFNEYIEKMGMKAKIEIDRLANPSFQKNASLSEEDADLFYKLYFALLEYTNNKYNIKPKLKIYKKEGLDPHKLTDIIDKLFENKNEIITEFCKDNPYKFSEEELEIIKEFKRGMRDIFVIGKLGEEYAYFIYLDKIYMVKGLRANFDEIFSSSSLPMAVMTSILPFKGNIVFDGIIMEYNINLGNGDFMEIVRESCEDFPKYYKL